MTSRGNAATPAFRLRGATVAYGDTPVLHAVDLEVATGESVALIGPSGAGKTTLLRALQGSVACSSGEAAFSGENWATVTGAARRSHRAQIGWIPQDFGLVPELRVSQNVLLGRAGSRSSLGTLRQLLWPTRDALGDVHEVLERVGIEEKLFARTSTLSGGQQQRVAVARALYQAPRALLADEPVASVDPARARETLQWLLRLSREAGLTTIVSLHDVDLARELFPRLVGLRDGRVHLDAPASDVTADALETLYALPGRD